MKNIKVFTFFLVFLVSCPFFSAFCQDLATGDAILDDTDLIQPSNNFENYVYCAAVMPCDSEGNVLKEYLGSGCEVVYQERCLRYKLNDVSEKECNCNKTLVKKNKTIKRLKARIKFLKGK